MKGLVENKVSKSGLITIDLAEYAPAKSFASLDVKKYLFNEMILKEKFFRTALKNEDFTVYKKKIVALHCSVDTIIPMWTYMLIASKIKSFGGDVYFGTEEIVFEKLFLESIIKIDRSVFQNKKVLIKGCGNIKIPESIYIEITKKLQDTVSSLMFGEACSSVPVFKKNVYLRK